MPKTQELKFDDATITIARPRFSQMITISTMISELADIDGVMAVMQHPSFLKVMEAACVTPKDFERLQDLDYADAYAVYESYLELGRFDDFLSEESRKQSQRKMKIMEASLEATRQQIDMLKKTGVLPKEFSMEDAIKEFGGTSIPDLLQSGAVAPSKPAAKTK